MKSLNPKSLRKQSPNTVSHKPRVMSLLAQSIQPLPRKLILVIWAPLAHAMGSPGGVSHLGGDPGAHHAGGGLRDGAIIECLVDARSQIQSTFCKGEVARHMQAVLA